MKWQMSRRYQVAKSLVTRCELKKLNAVAVDLQDRVDCTTATSAITRHRQAIIDIFGGFGDFEQFSVHRDDRDYIHPVRLRRSDHVKNIVSSSHWSNFAAPDEGYDRFPNKSGLQFSSAAATRRPPFQYKD